MDFLGALVAVLDHHGSFLNMLFFCSRVEFFSFSSFKWEWGLCILDAVNI